MTRAALCAALVASGACRAPAPRQSVDRVVVAETEAAQRLEGAGVGPDEVLRVAVEALRSSRTFGPRAPDGAAARRWLGRVAVHRAEATGGAAGPSAHVVLTLELSPQESGGTLRETARAVEPVGAGPRALRDAFSRATASALERAVGGFALLLAAERKREDELVADLGAPDARVRDCAVRVLADRKSRAAVPALVERLADPDPEVVERAIGALGQIGDPAAVPPLVRLAQKRQGPSVAHLARIIGDVGGPDARSYLLTLASGHADPLVRAAAQQALDEMEARTAEAGPARP
ncbi:MAG TPA: HEAT repeat domain-containing protein [Anaeromyxobacteraceae bacterium]